MPNIKIKINDSSEYAISDFDVLLLKRSNFHDDFKGHVLPVATYNHVMAYVHLESVGVINSLTVIDFDDTEYKVVSGIWVDGVPDFVKKFAPLEIKLRDVEQFKGWETAL